MKGITAFLQNMGISNIRSAFYGWFFNFIVSFLIGFSCYHLLSAVAGESVWDPGNSHTGLFTFFSEAIAQYPGGVLWLVFLALGLFLFYGVVSLFVSGGIYGVYIDGDRPTITNLAANSALNFFNMVKVVLVNILTLLSALVISGIFLLIGIILIQTDVVDVDHWSGWMVIGIWLAIVIFCLICVGVIYDFSRIYRIKDDCNVFRSLQKALFFCMTHKWPVFVLNAIYGVSLVLIYLIYWVVMGFWEEAFAPVFIFLVYQTFMVVRYYLKIALMRSEITLCEL